MLSCVQLCDPLDCSPPGSSVHGILQAGILEWVAISSSRESSWPRTEPMSPSSPALAGRSLSLSHLGSTLISCNNLNGNESEKKNVYMYICIHIYICIYIYIHIYIYTYIFPLLHTGNSHNTVNQHISFGKESSVVQWLRLQTPSAGGPGSIPGQGTRSLVPQLKPRVAK